jgi:transglutaminase-like putative cysteine protease
VSSGVQRTLLALLASALGAVPLCTLLSDRGWLVDVWLSMLVVLLPALVLRQWRPPSALHVWPGIVLLVPWLTARYVSDSAWFGCIPTGRTWHRVSTLLGQVHDVTQHGVAPVHSTVAIRLVICALLGVVAALVDLIAVVGRHGALAGVPLLVVYTVSGAVPHRPVSWMLFLAPAVAFLLLLAIDAREDRASWGHRVGHRGAAIARPAVALGGQRIAVLALAVAVLLPFATPTNGTNLVSVLLDRHSSSGGGSGGGSISPFASLKGQLTRTTPMDLVKVKITGQANDTSPFYLRVNVLPVFTNSGWRAGAGNGTTEPAGIGGLANDPPFGASADQTFTAQMTVLGMSGNPAIFAVPNAISGLNNAQWSPQDQLVVGAQVNSGETYSETVSQPEPTLADLRAAPENSQDPTMAKWLTLPRIPAQVRRLVDRLTKPTEGPYQRARAISDYFVDPANGFQYSLSTTQGDSGSDLVDFLTNKSGFCQQYAAAMAVMLRLANVPARVVLGYTHGVTSALGTFTVTTNDAHAWVEAYFSGVGWVPFDPTPQTGAPGASTATLAWAPHSVGGKLSGSGAQSAQPHPSHPVRPSSGPSNRSGHAAHAAAGAQSVPGWLVPVLVLLAIVLVLLTPWFVRTRRRRRRLRAGHSGDPDALWAELSDTAVDLGYVWSPTRTPRQVARWLGDSAGDARGSLTTLAHAVEQHRYAPPGTSTRADLRRELASVIRRLRTGRSRWVRLQAALWPASLGWLRRIRRR